MFPRIIKYFVLSSLFLAIAIILHEESGPLVISHLTKWQSTIIVIVTFSSLITFGMWRIRKKHDLLKKEKELAINNLLETEKEFKAFFDEDLTGNMVTNEKGIITDINQAFLNIFGYSDKGEIIGKEKKILYRDLSEYEFILNELRKKGSITNYQTVRRRKNGDYIFVFENIIAKFSNDGKLIKIKSYIYDITNQVTSDKLLKDIERKYIKVIHSIKSAFYFYRLSDNELIFTGSNPAANQIIGILHESMVGKNIKECFPDLPSYVPALYKDVARGVIGNQSFEIEYTEARFSGVYEVDVFRIDQNEIAVNFTDITERKMQENKLKNLNETKDKLFSIIGHDLRNPIGSIVNYSELLKRECAGKEARAKGFIDIISTSAERSLTLLEDLLLWAQSQTGQLDYKPELLSVDPVVTEVCEMLSPNAIIKEIDIKNSCSGNLNCYADKQMLKCILRNLVQNAIKFTCTGGSIEVSAHSEENNIKFMIADNGTGIDPAATTKLFKLAENTTNYGTSGEKGSGLGLIICKEFVQKHKGRIWVESEPGKGSRFYFTIPVSQN